MVTAKEVMDILGTLKNACINTGFVENNLPEFGKSFDIEISAHSARELDRISRGLSTINEIPGLTISTWQASHILWVIHQNWYRMEIPEDTEFVIRPISEVEASTVCELFNVAHAVKEAMNELSR